MAAQMGMLRKLRPPRKSDRGLKRGDREVAKRSDHKAGASVCFSSTTLLRPAGRRDRLETKDAADFHRRKFVQRRLRSTPHYFKSVFFSSRGGFLLCAAPLNGARLLPRGACCTIVVDPPAKQGLSSGDQHI